jgi:hypothetical protein
MRGWTRIGQLLLLGTFGALLLLPGCKQGENERCQIDDDCDVEFFYCYYASGNDKIVGGTCRSRTATPSVIDLAGLSYDLSTPDLSTPDLSATDM